MPDQSEIRLCIMGKPNDVKEVRKILSDAKGTFNPYRMYALDKVCGQVPSSIRPKKGETESDYKIRMQKEFDELEKRNYYRDAFRFHYGPVMNPADFPGTKFIDKEICFFERTDSPPIEEFVTISAAFKNVAFAMQFDSSWLTHQGDVYISRGTLWYSNYRFKHKDINGFDIELDENFDFRYLTKYKTLGMIVPPLKLQGIERNFKPLDPDHARYTFTYFPYPPLLDDHDPADEYLEDDYIPEIYEPSPFELRRFWDSHLAAQEKLNRHISNNLNKPNDPVSF